MMPQEDYGSCPCGCAWFRIAPYDDSAGDDEAAVCVSLDGEITGYAGKLACIDCGADWDPNLRFRPTTGHLRIVD
jgi:hypothetical protein